MSIWACSAVHDPSEQRFTGKARGKFPLALPLIRAPSGWIIFTSAIGVNPSDWTGQRC